MADGTLFLAEELKNIHNDELSILGTTQADLERLYSKYQVFHCIAEEFKKAGVEKALRAEGIPTSFGVDLLVQIFLHKRAAIPVLVGLLKKHFQHEANPAQACTDMLHLAIEKDVVDWNDMSGVVVCRHAGISEETLKKLERFQYPLPMIEKPQTVRNNRQTGYQTIEGSLILRNNHHEEDICLDHINRTNSIPLTLNADVVAFVQNKWKNLDKPKEGESREDFQKRKAAFQKYDRSSRDILSALMIQGNRFWLTHKYDKRGRTYCQGYHVNYQGNDWNKAVIEFADQEPLNKE